LSPFFFGEQKRSSGGGVHQIVTELPCIDEATLLWSFFVLSWTYSTSPLRGATKKTTAMNSRIFLSRLDFERHAFSRFFLSALILIGAANAAVQANEILAGAQLSGVSLGRGEYAYTLTLSNTPASTSDIGMFWFAWESGEADFLASEPTSIQTPSGWSATVEGGGAGDGYSVQFVTFTNPLTPGSFVTFTFKSTDSPKIMSETASLFPGYPTLTSQVYSGHAADGLQEVFIAQLVQPASSTNLTISITGQQLVLAWPTNAANYTLQTTTNLYSQTGWTTVTNIPAVNGSSNAVNLAITNASQFFRLQSQ
jgi:hypothetical protein